MSKARVLFTCRPLDGHYQPLVPLARATQAAGHTVAFASGEPIASRAQTEGFETFVSGPGQDFRNVWTPRFPDFDRLVGDEQRRFFFTEIFANLELAPRAEELDRVVDSWAPDLVVHEMAELAAPLVSATHSIPCVDVGYGVLIPRHLLTAAGTAAAPHWKARGLDADPVAGLFRELYIDTCPPSLQIDEIKLMASVQSMRPAAAELAADETPPWLDNLPDRPTVYLTLGTVWNQNLDIFKSVIDALSNEHLNLIVTVGHNNDPAVLGSQADNVLVHRYVPQAQLLPRCDLAIVHGGAGSTLGALAFGVPLLVLPQGADQYYNADRVVAAGAGRCLLPDDLSTSGVREHVLDLLAHAKYRDAARKVQHEIQSMPSPADVVHSLEAVVSGASPR